MFLLAPWGEEVEPPAGAAERLTLMARVLHRALTTGNSSLDLSRAPACPSATPTPLSRKRFEVSDH